MTGPCIAWVATGTEQRVQMEQGVHLMQLRSLDPGSGLRSASSHGSPHSSHVKALASCVSNQSKPASWAQITYVAAVGDVQVRAPQTAGTSSFRAV